MEENIAHYTKFESVFKILESKSLWATNFQFLNDTTELNYGLMKIWIVPFLFLIAKMVRHTLN